MRRLIVALTLVVTAFIPPGKAQDQQHLRYTVVYSDDSWRYALRDEYLSWQVAPGTGNSPLFLTPYLDAEKLEAGDGERRGFGPGIVLVTDIVGQGHRTSNTGPTMLAV